MHLPWTQIENEAVEEAEALARLVGLDPLAGVGLVVKLHRWALRRAPDGDFEGLVGDPDPGELIAAEVGLAVDGGKLWRALVRCGFAGGEGLEGRIRGLPRYEAAWLRNRRSGHGKDPARGVPARVPPGSRGDPTSSDADADADADRRGSMSSPPEKDREDKNEKGSPQKTPHPVENLDRARSFLAFARELDEPAFGDPGPQVLKWARYQFAKHPTETDDKAMRLAFRRFVLWCGMEKKKAGWGLWLMEKVWSTRFDDARAELRAA